MIFWKKRNESPGRTARRLVQLVDTEVSKYDELSREQKDRWSDRAYVDGWVRSGERCPEWLAGMVEIRTIGYRLNANGGLSLMRKTASRAGDLSNRRMAERYLNHFWDRIGGWQH